MTGPPPLPGGPAGPAHALLRRGHLRRRDRTPRLRAVPSPASRRPLPREADLQARSPAPEWDRPAPAPRRLHRRARPPDPHRAGGRLARRRPLPPALAAITATARAVSAGNLHQRLDLGGPADELTELGSILDDLSPALRPPSTPSGTSSPTPPTSCAPPSPGCGPSSKSPSPTPTPTPAPCARPARRPSLLAGIRSGSSRPCSPWPPASAASPAATPSTSPKPSQECSPPAATRQQRKASTSPRT